MRIWVEIFCERLREHTHKAKGESCNLLQLVVKTNQISYFLPAARRVGDLLEQPASGLLHHPVRLVVDPDVGHDRLALHEPSLCQPHRARDGASDAAEVS